MSSEPLAFETLAIHTDGHDKPKHAHVMPVFQTSSYVFDSPQHGADLFAGKVEGHIYSRLGNPTVEHLEKIMAKLECGHDSVAFSSGMGATLAATMPFLNSGESIMVSDTLYGCTVDLVHDHYPRYGIECITVDPSNLDDMKAQFKPNTKLIYLETPANPTNKMCDIEEISNFAHSKGAMVVVDGTFASPYFQCALKCGADIIMHSMTKYIGGHGDIIGGILTTTTADQSAKIREFRKVSGGILAPMEAFLAIRGLRTLALRMERIQQSGIEIAKWLKAHPLVIKVYCPYFEEDVGHKTWKKQMTGIGGTFSFTVKGGYEAAKRLLEEVKLCVVCVSLGAVDTLIEHPASMTHACVPEELMIKQGLTKDMVRISVGLEAPKDIINDLAQAFEHVAKPKEKRD